MSFEAMADAQYAQEMGRANRDCCWILSDRDVWYRNPFYTGPAVPHPDDERYDDDEQWDADEEAAIANEIAEESSRIEMVDIFSDDPYSNDIEF